MASDTLGPAHTNGRVATAAAVIGHITDHTTVIDALGAITILVAQTGHTLRAAQTNGRCSTAAGVIGHITELALLGDTLLASITIAIGLATHTAHAIAIVDADRRITAAARIGA